MNKIYQEISSLSSKFREMCYGLTQDEEAINDAVQELMLYYLQMNPETLKGIWEKDGQEGLIRYGAIILRRALTSVRSPFYYKYKKYYTRLHSGYNTNFSMGKAQQEEFHKSIYNMPEVVEEYKWTKLEEIDKVLDKQTWYDKKIFELYYSGETLDSLAKKTGISRNSLFTTIDKVRDILKKELNENK
jgi:DNA-directed RNA polymerase specialized sigma24 family protein